MIDFSKKAADRFRIPWAGLPVQSGDHWKIDVIMVGRYPFLLIVHEYTLFTLVRRKSDCKTLDPVVEEIRRCCPWYAIPENVTPGRNPDRRRNGSITEMKYLAEGLDSVDFCERMERRIRHCLFSILSEDKYGYSTPEKALERYKKGEWPPAS